MHQAAGTHRYWIDLALACVRRDHSGGPEDQTGPFRSARALGMALAAPHVVNRLASGQAPLLALPPAPALLHLSPAQLEVAACAACCELLRLRYPHQLPLLDPAWLYWLETQGHGAAGSTAELAGRAIGAAIHQLGIDDPRHAAGNMYRPSGLPYTHEAPPNQPDQAFAGADWGGAKRLLTTHVDGFPPPPGRDSATKMVASAHYQADFAHVLAKGAINAPRTPDEEFIGIAWGYDGAHNIGTPPRLYMQAVLSVLDATEATAAAPALTVAEELEVIAGVGLAMADAGIDAWHYKYAPTHMMWRPAVGIPKADPAHGTPPDARFLPLGRPDTNKRGLALTPDFPAYPSGHATFGAAAFELLRLYLADKRLTSLSATGVDCTAVDFVSDEYDGMNRDPRTLRPREKRAVQTASLWQAIVDNSVSRVFLGVHWQFDGLTARDADGKDVFAVDALTTLTPATLGRTGGVWLGRELAKQVALRLGVSAATIADAR